MPVDRVVVTDEDRFVDPVHFLPTDDIILVFGVEELRGIGEIRSPPAHGERTYPFAHETDFCGVRERNPVDPDPRVGREGEIFSFVSVDIGVTAERDRARSGHEYVPIARIVRHRAAVRRKRAVLHVDAVVRVSGNGTLFERALPSAVHVNAVASARDYALRARSRIGDFERTHDVNDDPVCERAVQSVSVQIENDARTLRHQKRARIIRRSVGAERRRIVAVITRLPIGIKDKGLLISVVVQTLLNGIQPVDRVVVGKEYGFVQSVHGLADDAVFRRLGKEQFFRRGIRAHVSFESAREHAVRRAVYGKRILFRHAIELLHDLDHGSIFLEEHVRFVNAVCQIVIVNAHAPA